MDKRPQDMFYPAVQGLRGICAVSVMFAHVYIISVKSGFYLPHAGALGSILQTAGAGVAMFFIISGFVIPGSLRRHRNVAKFMIDRALRVMPLFLVLQIMIFAIGPWIGYKWLATAGPGTLAWLFVTNATFLAFPFGLPLVQRNSWTLTYEWAFYIFVAAAWSAYRRWPNQVVLALLTLAGAAICSMFPICLYFLIGVLFSRYHAAWRTPPWMEAIILATCVPAFYYSMLHFGIVAAAPFAVVIFNLALQPASLTSQALCHRGVQFLGLISYSLYLVHPLMIYPVRAVAMHAVARGISSILVFPIYAAVSITLTIVASTLSYRWLEVALRRWMARRIAPAPAMAT